MAHDSQGNRPIVIFIKSVPEKQNIPQITDDFMNTPGTSTKCLKITTEAKFYLTFENASNLCWLDASLSILIHNRFLKTINAPRSQTVEIVSLYDEAIYKLNDVSLICDARLEIARSLLKICQKASLSFLKSKVKYTEGVPDSALCSLYNLLNEDTIRHLFDVEFILIKECDKCKVVRSRGLKKPIITLSQVVAFSPQKPVVICQCQDCKEPNQKMTLLYRNLPSCLIFHFESGAGHKKLQLNFKLDSRYYELAGIIIWEKGKELRNNHFYTWIRNPVSNCWLICNDLDPQVKKFSSIAPVINLDNIHIVAYEAVDTFGSQIVSCSQENEDIKTHNDDFPVIDITDDDDDNFEVQNSVAPNCRDLTVPNLYENSNVGSLSGNFSEIVASKALHDIVDCIEPNAELHGSLGEVQSQINLSSNVSRRRAIRKKRCYLCMDSLTETKKIRNNFKSRL